MKYVLALSLVIGFAAKGYADSAKEAELKAIPTHPYMDFLKQFLQSLSSQSHHAELNQKYHEQRRNKYLQWATLTDAPDDSQKADEVGKHFRSASQSVATHQLEEHIGLTVLADRGLEFDLDFSRPFQEAPEQAAPAPIQYGLVVKDLEPAKNSQMTAALGAERAQEVLGAPKAQVEYTIGPLPPKAPAPVVPKALGEEHVTDRLPSPAFKGQVKKKAAIDPNQAKDSKLPPMVVSLVQKEDYYRMDYHTKNGLEKETIHHGLGMPLYKNLKAGREYDEDWRPVKASLQNVLIEDHRPLVNLHYFDHHDLYETEISTHLMGAQWGVKARSKNPEDIQIGERYEVSVGTHF